MAFDVRNPLAKLVADSDISTPAMNDACATSDVPVPPRPSGAIPGFPRLRGLGSGVFESSLP